jgi:hypothetical protein
MQIRIKALLLLALGASLGVAVAADARAADLSVSPAPRVGTRVIRHARLPVVRDYDGTPIMVRGNVAIPVPAAQPSRYLNGQPVKPAARL